MSLDVGRDHHLHWHQGRIGVMRSTVDSFWHRSCASADITLVEAWCRLTWLVKSNQGSDGSTNGRKVLGHAESITTIPGSSDIEQSWIVGFPWSRQSSGRALRAR